MPAVSPLLSSTSFVPAKSAQSKVYGAVPPEAVMFITPVDSPLHNAAVLEATVRFKTGGWVMLTDKGATEQLLASVTVTVYVPLVRPVLSSGSLEPGISDQLKVYGATPFAAVMLI